MPVKNFKFVSPGVFINEIDNSFRPRRSDTIGPVIVGRSTRGLAMQPVTVESYSDFVTQFGGTVPGNAGGDVYRGGNYQSPMYGTYAAKAFLNANVAPVTYIRLLGQETTVGSAAGGDAAAGWKTSGSVASSAASNGGSYGLWVFPNKGLTAATATITFGAEVTGSGITIISSDSTSLTYVTGAAENTSLRTFVTSSATAAAASLKNCIEASAGHNGKITVSDNGTGVLTLTQAVGGITGNKTIALVNSPTAMSGATPSGFSGGSSDIGAGTLSSIFYIDRGYVQLSGTYLDGAGGTATTGAAGHLITTDANGLFTLEVYNESSALQDKVKFNFDDSSEFFARKRFSTNPQLTTAQGAFYPSASAKTYWLGETFEQELRDGSESSLGNLTTNTELVGIVLALTNGTETSSNMKKQASREAVAGWFIGQDLGAPSSFAPADKQKLFRLIGRGHGEWLHKNAKVSIQKIRQSTTTTTEYGTFSIVIRDLRDTDNNVVVLERFDNLTLDPSSPNYVARKIGDRYYQWDSTEKRLKEYGDYPNQSRYIRVEMNDDVDAGATDPVLLPFGYFGPPKITNITNLSGSGVALTNSFVKGKTDIPTGVSSVLGATSFATASLLFPSVRLRVSASDGGLSDPTDAYFGMMSTRKANSTNADGSIADPHRLLYSGFPPDPTITTPANGITGYSYVFSLNDLTASSGRYYYESGSRTAAAAAGRAEITETTIISAEHNRFTAPFWGGFDGFDIKKPDPMYNEGMAASTEDSSYAYHTIRRAIDTVADPEFINMNLLTVPGLTQESLTTHMVNVCESRADAMAIIDLPNVYKPAHEGYEATKSDRIGTTPNAASTALRDRRIDSSYGATFYPWVQTRDDNSGQLVWIPPSVAMMGVLASSERSTQIWYAPAGFNRGGLSDGAAGIPVTNVSERLTSKQRDLLYDARINPIASFPSSGIVVFGQKTLQERPSALDRINVRRLVIYLKKQISILSTQILFEQNVQATWNRFKGLIEPFLANVKVQFGISDYRLILDETTTTPDLIDQNVLYAKIMVKPARAIEYIAIDFVVASTGASFDD